MPKFDPSLLPPSPDVRLEAALWAAGVERLCGLDETGRGALAGPVAAAAVILPPHPHIAQNLLGVRDSKTMSPAQRARWGPRIQKYAAAWQVSFATPQEIDRLGIIPATRLAMHRALAGLHPSPDHLLIDHLLLPDSDLPQTALTKGDARSLTIAAASVLAKLTRDRAMEQLDAAYPSYGFAAHKGYGTRTHREYLSRWGPSPVHRLTFAPMRETTTTRG